MTAFQKVYVHNRFWRPEEIESPERVARLDEAPALFNVPQGPIELPELNGPLTLKTVRVGRSCYRFGRQPLSVSPGQILIAPSGEYYRTLVESFAHVVSVYVPNRMVRSAVAALHRTDDELLDAGGFGADLRVAFVPHIRNDADGLSDLIHYLAESCDMDQRYEGLWRLAGAAASLALDAARRTRLTGARRPSVRAELFRRISLVRQRLEMEPEAPLTLDDLAATAALSPFHLLRVFHYAFGETPAQMKRRLCIERAKALLAAGVEPIIAVAQATGFESQAAFSRAFRRATGMSPTGFQLSRCPDAPLKKRKRGKVSRVALR